MILYDDTIWYIYLYELTNWPQTCRIHGNWTSKHRPDLFANKPSMTNVSFINVIAKFSLLAISDLISTTKLTLLGFIAMMILIMIIIIIISKSLSLCCSGFIIYFEGWELRVCVLFDHKSSHQQLTHMIDQKNKNGKRKQIGWSCNESLSFLDRNKTIAGPRVTIITVHWL